MNFENAVEILIFQIVLIVSSIQKWTDAKKISSNIKIKLNIEDK